MNLRQIFSSTVVLSALLTLSACGGGDSSSPAANSQQNQQIYATTFGARFSAGLSALGTSSGLAAMAVADVFDAAYLDMGVAKANVVAALSTTSQTLGSQPELSLFPMAEVTNPTLTGCDGNDICTLNATLVNSDADTTSVDFSIPVKVVAGVVYLYGNQSSTSSI